VLFEEMKEEPVKRSLMVYQEFPAWVVLKVCLFLKEVKGGLREAKKLSAMVFYRRAQDSGEVANWVTS
jgi:hypothetical protein